MNYKIPKDQIDKLKQSIKDETKEEILAELEKRKVRLDSSDLDIILNHVKSNIEFKLDSQKIVIDLLRHVVKDEDQKRIDFYRDEVFSQKVRTDFIKRVLDQIPTPEDGTPGEKGEKGDPGKDGTDYTLTEEDKQYIASLNDPSERLNDFRAQLNKIVKDIKTGKLRPPNAGLDVREILKEINQTGPLFDYIQFPESTQLSIPNEAGVVSWNNIERTININTGLGTVIQAGQETVVLVCNTSGVDIPNGSPTYVTGSFQGCPTVAKANAQSHETIFGAVGVATTDIPTGGFGFVADFGAVRGFDTSALALNVPIYVGTGAGNDGTLTDSRPSFPNYAIQIGQVLVQDETDGVIALKVDQNANDTFVNFYNGTFRESISFTVSSNGSTITGSLSPANGHENMTMIFSDGFTTLDTTPAMTIALTPGTSTVPLKNFVYIPKSTKALTVSTTDWPTTEHIKVADVVLRTAAITQTDGALANRNWNDHVQDTITNQGHLAHICEKIRQGDAQWKSGVQASVSGTPSNVYVSTTSGIVYQLHRQTFPSQSMPTNDIHVVNNFASNFVTVTNLNTQTLDALGNSLANFSFSFVIWGIQNRSGTTSHLMCNLPVGTYPKNAPATAVSDPSNYSVYTIPDDYKGVGFLICRLTFVLEADGVTWSLYNNQDLRGRTPNTVAGGGGAGTAVEFPDSLFRIQNSNDDTKEIDFDASGITTANTRTIIMPDTDVYLGATKTGTLASPPTGLVPGEFWRDTTDSAVHPIIRYSTVTT